MTYDTTMGSPSAFGSVEYLGYRLLQELEAKKGRVPRSFFLKVWCITDRYLSEEYQYDSGLPRYWYKYGELADEHSVNTFYHAPTAPWGGQMYISQPDIEPEDFEISEDTEDTIEHGVKWAIQRFGNRNTRYVKSHQYFVHAPNEFIRAYSELRDKLQYLDLKTQSTLTSEGGDYSSNKETVKNLLDQMVVAYPDEDPYETLYDLYLRWDDTARMLLEGEPKYKDLDRFLDAFIEALSRCVLQFEYNSNIPPNRINRWKEQEVAALEDFETLLETTREALLSDREFSGVLEQVAETYDENIVAEMDTIKR